jgi:RNA polymerase sigma factor (sigma-70 family)
MESQGLTALLEAAAGGDQDAWNTLVERYSRLVWAVARGHRLSQADAADVTQATWLRLVEHLDGIKEPERLGAWLATTARRESLRQLGRAGRDVPVGDGLDAGLTPMGPADAGFLLAERDTLLWKAVDSLGDRCRTLLRVLMADPPPSYEEVAAALGMPVGSIGPIRGRCLDRLRQLVDP